MRYACLLILQKAATRFDLCERIEQGGRDKQWPGLLELKPQLDEELRRLNRFLDML